MKINWKVLFALVLVVGGIYWAMASTRSSSYAGSNLTFAVGSGPVTMTNPSDESISVQLVGTGTRSFSVLSTIEGVAGSSILQGTWSTRTRLFEFKLPPGISEFTVTRGTNVNFTANTDTNLAVTVQPINGDEALTITLVVAIVVLGALFYISRTTGHRWIGILRRKNSFTEDTQPIAVIAGSGLGQAIQPYGDNRANKED